MTPARSDQECSSASLTVGPTEREKWDAERSDRKIEQLLKERETESKLLELRRSRLSSPLTVAIIAAAVAAGGNAYVAHQNGDEQRGLEEGKAEAARILEAIKAPDPDKAAANLNFLLGAGLITGGQRRQDIGAYLQNRRGGQGASLQAGAALLGPAVRPVGPAALPSMPSAAPSAVPSAVPPAAPSAVPDIGGPPPTIPVPAATAETATYRTGWIGGGHNQAEACQSGLAELGPKHPGKRLSPLSSNEISNKDLLGHVTYNYTCVFRISPS